AAILLSEFRVIRKGALGVKVQEITLIERQYVFACGGEEHKYEPVMNDGLGGAGKLRKARRFRRREIVAVPTTAATAAAMHNEKSLNMARTHANVRWDERREEK
ncbi:hypothetical protein, partial [Chryseobacterium contaminans]|uniref:hypothetical protein n=1 Tax=Chryseobacterium contaminans TaxID=1423959 RepID=UPI0013F4F01D